MYTQETMDSFFGEQTTEFETERHFLSNEPENLKTTPLVSPSGQQHEANQVTNVPTTKPIQSVSVSSISTPGMPTCPRRSSSRSIKRPKFDDELVDATAFKRISHRKTSESSPSEQKSKKSLSRQSSHVLNLQPKKKIKKIKPKPVPMDFGRWRPVDDLTLITAVTQTCDLQAVHLAVKFSCNFTLKEIQDRWFALLYDPLISRLSQQAMKALPSEVINKIQSNPLWSREEEAVLTEIEPHGALSLEDFQHILDKNLKVFHKSRTAQTLHNHWLILRHYHLLTSQSARNTTAMTTLMDIENKMFDDHIIGPEDDDLHQELTFTDLSNKREINRLEHEIPQWETMLERSGLVQELEVTSFPCDTLAVLKGRILKYHMKKHEIIIGRKNDQLEVDIDLSVEGPALKISRKQGVLTLSEGNFHLHNFGNRPFYVNGAPLSNSNTTILHNNSVIEIYCMKFLFNINPNHQNEALVRKTEKAE